jgi:LEA14-like dessication related protein
MSARHRLILVSLVAALAACSNLGRPAVTPEPPAVTGVSSSGLELGVALHVDNPNPFALLANGVTGTLFLDDDKRVGTGTAHLDQPIPAKGSGTVQSQLDIGWSSAGALREFIGKSQVPFTFKGELAVSGGPLKVSVPFELRGQLTRAQLLSIGGSVLAPLLR